jgi:hypothetical protein
LLRSEFFVAVGNADDEAILRPHGFNFEAAFGANFCGDGHAPWSVNASAKGSEDADAAIAEFVAAGFDDEVLIAGDAGGGDGLLFEVAEKIFCGVGIEAVSVNELSESGGTWEGE